MPGNLEKLLKRKLYPVWGPSSRFNVKKCSKCGKCCKETNVFITFEEIKNISKKTGLPALATTRNITVENLKLKRLTGKHLGGGKQACYFYTGNSCKLHEKYGEKIKPYTCWTYPYMCLDEYEVPDHWNEKQKERCKHTFTQNLRLLSSERVVYLAYDEMCPGVGSGKGVGKKELPSMVHKMINGKRKWYETAERIKGGETLVTPEDINFGAELVKMFKDPDNCKFFKTTKNNKTFSCFIEPGPDADINIEKIMDSIELTLKEFESMHDMMYWAFILQKDYEYVGTIFGVMKDVNPKELGKTLKSILTDHSSDLIKQLGFGFYDMKTGECCTLN